VRGQGSTPGTDYNMQKSFGESFAIQIISGVSGRVVKAEDFVSERARVRLQGPVSLKR
jgi:hypothetical protein